MVYYLADTWQKDFAKNLDKIIKEKRDKLSTVGFTP